MRNFIQLSLVFVFIALFTPNVFAQKKLIGEGPMVERVLNLAEFDEIGLAISATVYFRLGNKQAVKIKGQANVIDAINMEIEDDSWNIKFEDKKYKNWNNQYEPLEIMIMLEDLDAINIAGGGRFIGDGPINIEDLEINIAGGGFVELTGSASDLELNVAGGGKAELKGFEVAEAEVNVAGGGHAVVHVSDDLEANVAGGGNIQYAGDPKKVEKSSVFGKIRQID